MEFKPISDWVLVEEIKNAEETTVTGLVLPNPLNDLIRGKVLAVGSGRYENGFKITPEIYFEDVVLFFRGNGIPIKFNNQEFILIKETGIYCKIIS